MNNLLQIQNLIYQKIFQAEPGPGNFNIVGTNNISSIAMLIAGLDKNFFNRFNNIFIFPDSKSLAQFHKDLVFYSTDFHIHRLGGFDVSPYSSLYPNHYTLHQRLGFLGALNKTSFGKQIYLACLKDILQPTLPQKTFKDFSFKVTKGMEINGDFFIKLKNLGYIDSEYVEDLGQFANKGGVIDIFIPSYPNPFRIELFGDEVEEIRSFHAENQSSIDSFEDINIIPCKEVCYSFFNNQSILESFRKDCKTRNVSEKSYEVFIHNIVRNKNFQELPFFISYAYDKLDSVLSYSSRPVLSWCFDSQSLTNCYDKLLSENKNDYLANTEIPICPKPESLLLELKNINDCSEYLVNFNSIEIQQDMSTDTNIPFKVESNADFQNLYLNKKIDPITGHNAKMRIQFWKQEGQSVFIFCNTNARAKRLKLVLEHMGFEVHITDFNPNNLTSQIKEQNTEQSLLHLFTSSPFSGFRLNSDNLVFLTEQNFFGNKSRATKNTGNLKERADRLHFSELSPGDRVVHIQHGVGVYQGLKEMAVQGYPSEFVEVEYKDKDKLYLPIYRISQIKKYTGTNLIDRLGSKNFEKAQIKVKNTLKDIANELLQLYARRSKVKRLPFGPPGENYYAFEDQFPYEETEGQIKSINSVLDDLKSNQPMDRLICGDVGFGKTEIAMRAAFKAVEAKKQVAILVPTTVLAFQHYENFIKRFKKWKTKIISLSRFTSKQDSKEFIEKIKLGDVDIVIGTHRILSKDIKFYNLGLLIIDEEQRFGVIHKEKIRRLKLDVDTLSLSATPIPRTLNMSLVGLKDLSVINTPPQDRLPVRTFLMKYNQETIKKSILNEVERGGQVYFVHNRVQSIYAKLEELQSLLPDVSFRVGHGQMKEDELEKTMLSFFKAEFQVLLCTTIIESGLDNTNANTMVLDNAHMFGLSQLYQLRGRVGRGTQRAYCYLLLPQNTKLDKTAQERLKVIQQNTALGSGFKIAHHDLELRGAGNLLGDEQSGSLNVVGYDLYYELLENAIKEVRGEKIEDHLLEPEINLPISALIPDSYIGDIRTRLAYYKALSEIKSAYELDEIETDLKDQFGKLPEEVINLMGLMLIRKICRDLGIRDISASRKNISLAFTENTKLEPVRVVQLSITQPNKYKITPDNRLIVTPEKIEWPVVLNELEELEKLL